MLQQHQYQVTQAVFPSRISSFAPSVVAEHWDSGREVVSLREAAWANVESCRDFGRVISEARRSWPALSRLRRKCSPRPQADELIRNLLEPAYSALDEPEGGADLRAP